jgi:hypothetical protein
LEISSIGKLEFTIILYGLIDKHEYFIFASILYLFGHNLKSLPIFFNSLFINY